MCSRDPPGIARLWGSRDMGRSPWDRCVGLGGRAHAHTHPRAQGPSVHGLKPSGRALGSPVGPGCPCRTGPASCAAAHWSPSSTPSGSWLPLCAGREGGGARFDPVHTRFSCPLASRGGLQAVIPSACEQAGTVRTAQTRCTDIFCARLLRRMAYRVNVRHSLSPKRTGHDTPQREKKIVY